MMRLQGAGLALGLIALGSVAPPAEARTVDYGLDAATLEKAAADQLDGPMSPPPARDGVQLAFAADPGVDHVTIAAGVGCSAYKVENPVTLMLPPLLESWDADGKLDATGNTGAATFRLTRASSFNRCVQLDEFNGRCITRVKLAGTLSLPGSGGTVEAIAIKADVERSGKVGGFCTNLARFIGIVSREAGIALIADARSQLAAHQPAVAAIN